MSDVYLDSDSGVLRNLLGITDSDELDVAEAELSRVNMMLLHDQGFREFSTAGMRTIHKALFGDVYDWAGEFRIINIQKRKPILAGVSVWYSNSDDIERDLEASWASIHDTDWSGFAKDEFVKQLVRQFSTLWKIHPYREGNTRSIVMMLTFFVEHHGFYLDQELLAESAGYVRNAFVMASMGGYAEPKHLERILMDAISVEPILYPEETDEMAVADERPNAAYRSTEYKPVPHEYREDGHEKHYKLESDCRSALHGERRDHRVLQHRNRRNRIPKRIRFL